MPTSISDDPARLRAFVLKAAREAGFEVAGIAEPDALEPLSADLPAFLAAGHHGDMAWMAERADWRADPRALWPQVRSIVMVGLNYGPRDDPRAGLGQAGHGVISVYARNRDYHDVLKGRLKTLAGRLAARSGQPVKVFVDTAPVMEKPLAAAAGLGWQGRHTNLVSRDFGSWLFLGAIYSAADMIPDPPAQDLCGSCTACLEACPTDAFPAPGRIDARRCVSYLTIENKGPVPRALRPLLGNRIYGCDDCLAACPWNKFARQAAEIRLRARDDLVSPRLADLLALDDASFRALFAGNPVKRIGRARFLRNVALAAGNSGDAALAPPLA
ncbi:MAG: tRNA epoxyqueuosine(34) reductase QueG, partial [Rhizobiaceae bacterium]